MRFWLLIGGFLVLVGLLAVGLRLDPREVPSPLIGKPAPAFELPLLQQPDKSFSQKDMLGTVWVMNVWASWCPPCLVEHPVVSEFARSGIAPVVGLNYKDGRDEGMQWLKRFGDPYSLSAFDVDGKVGIDFGVYGVPETFVIDKKGVIRYKQIGPITPEALEKTLMPLIRELNA